MSHFRKIGQLEPRSVNLPIKTLVYPNGLFQQQDVSIIVFNMLQGEVKTHHSLLLKEFPLSDGVIQLCVRITYLLFHDEELEALSQSFLRSVPGEIEKRSGRDNG